MDNVLERIGAWARGLAAETETGCVCRQGNCTEILAVGERKREIRISGKGYGDLWVKVDATGLKELSTVMQIWGAYANPVASIVVRRGDKVILECPIGDCRITFVSRWLPLVSVHFTPSGRETQDGRYS